MDIGWVTRTSGSRLGAGSPERAALHFEDREQLDYAELFRRQSELANGLVALGVAPGDRVGVLMRNCVDYVCLYFAIARIGAVTVRLNFRLSPRELAFALDDAGCETLCLQPEFCEPLAQVIDVTPVRTRVVFGEAFDGAGDGVIPTSALARHGDADPGLPLPRADDR